MSGASNGAAVGIGLVLTLHAAALAFGQSRSDLDGVWLFTGSEVPDDLHLTPAGQAALDAYEPLIDDGDNYCIPVSFTNIMHTPSPPFEIRQHDDYVEINYEFMDVRRRVPLDPSLTVETAPPTVPDHPHLGRSVGRYEGETLVVETAGVQAGVLDTLGVPGLPQSAQMRTEERFTATGDELEVVVAHHDPVYYARDLVVTYGFHRLDSEILEWGCEPEAASYDRYLKRNERNEAE
ncbi:MAG TPA: hypothetical protein VIN61_15190 [Gammaproteobacteria bacterium]